MRLLLLRVGLGKGDAVLGSRKGVRLAVHVERGDYGDIARKRDAALQPEFFLASISIYGAPAAVPIGSGSALLRWRVVAVALRAP